MFTVWLFLISKSTYAKQNKIKEGLYFSFKIKSTCDKYLKIFLLLSTGLLTGTFFLIIFYFLQTDSL